MKKYLVLSGVVSAMLIAAGVKETVSPKEAAFEYILQGAQQNTIIENVRDVGGEVVFSHSVIQAVSVKLTDS